MGVLLFNHSPGTQYLEGHFWSPWLSVEPQKCGSSCGSVTKATALGIHKFCHHSTVFSTLLPSERLTFSPCMVAGAVDGSDIHRGIPVVPGPDSTAPHITREKSPLKFRETGMHSSSSRNSSLKGLGGLQQSCFALYFILSLHFPTHSKLFPFISYAFNTALFLMHALRKTHLLP